jgi:aspartyl-tRNA synthetase
VRAGLELPASLRLTREENKWNAMHHPFTRPKTEDMPLFGAKKFPEIRAEAYDVVLNGSLWGNILTNALNPRRRAD